MVVGTAGHVDHGKTRLLEALTGIDCDRWREEKERGITIDLGFAHLVDGDLQIGFVDVPGHERFLHNALAGLGGIRLVLLVVAADEGAMPQTLEHLEICRLLEIPDAVIALSKRDLVDDDTAALARLEIEELLEGGPFEGAPIVEVSATTGTGVDTLRRVLVERCRAAVDDVAAAADASQPFRMPIDRAFQLPGLGVVVTGSPIAGRVEVGQGLEVQPAPRTTAVRVRGVQVHAQDRRAASAGERTALQLGGADLEELARGQQLVTSEIFAANRGLLIAATLAEPERVGERPSLGDGWTDVRVHLYASDLPGRARRLGSGPGDAESELIELRLARPVVAVRGDRLILRRPSPATTLGGGVVLDPRWRRRRNQARALRAAERLAGDRASAIETWTLDAGPRGLDAGDLGARLGLRRPRAEGLLAELVSSQTLLRLRDRFVHPRTVLELVEAAKAHLAEFFRAQRLAPGMPKAELVGRLLPPAARDDAETYLKWLAAAGVLRVDGDLVNPPGRRVAEELSGEESDLSRRLLAAIEAEGLTPPSPAELARRLGVKPQILDGVQRYLVSERRLVRLPSGLILSARAVDQVRDELRATGWDTFSVPEFKERWSLTRKWAIPLLEHLDSLGVTRRLGDRRQVVRRPPGSTEFSA